MSEWGRGRGASPLAAKEHAVTSFTVSFELVSDTPPEQVAALIEDFLAEEFMDELDPQIVDVKVRYV